MRTSRGLDLSNVASLPFHEALHRVMVNVVLDAPSDEQQILTKVLRFDSTTAGDLTVGIRTP